MSGPVILLHWVGWWLPCGPNHGRDCIFPSTVEANLFAQAEYDAGHMFVMVPVPPAPFGVNAAHTDTDNQLPFVSKGYYDEHLEQFLEGVRLMTSDDEGAGASGVAPAPSVTLKEGGK